MTISKLSPSVFNSIFFNRLHIEPFSVLFYSTWVLRLSLTSQVISIAFYMEKGPGGASGKALRYELNGPGSIPGVGGVEIFLHSFMSRLVLGSTQPPIK